MISRGQLQVEGREEGFMFPTGRLNREINVDWGERKRIDGVGLCLRMGGMKA